jgi:hypothetical protein
MLGTALIWVGVGVWALVGRARRARRA